MIRTLVAVSLHGHLSEEDTQKTGRGCPGLPCPALMDEAFPPTCQGMEDGLQPSRTLWSGSVAPPGGQPFRTPGLWLLRLPGRLGGPGKGVGDPRRLWNLRIERENSVLGISSPKILNLPEILLYSEDKFRFPWTLQGT